MRYLIMYLFAFFLVGCTAEWHIKRAIRKDPLILVRDAEVYTVYDTITVVTHGDSRDTIFHKEKLTDTLYLPPNESKPFGNIVYTPESIYVYLECPADTILVPYVQEKTVLNAEIDEESGFAKFFKWAGIILVLFIVLVVALKLL